MLSWAQAQLANNNATYTILATHFPLFGGKIQNGDSTAVFGTGTATKGVLPAYPGNFGCFATLNGLVQQYKPQFYINGHGARRGAGGLLSRRGEGRGRHQQRAISRADWVDE